MIDSMVDLGKLYQGFKIIESKSMTVDRITKTKRSFFKRLFSGIFTQNWDPKRTHDETVERGLPDDRLIITEDSIIGHPKTLQVLYDLIDKQNKEKAL